MHTTGEINRCLSRLPAAFRCDSGTSIVEFALVSPILILITVAIAQYGLVFTTMQQVRHEANQYARAIVAKAIEPADAEAECTGKLKMTCHVTDNGTSISFEITFAPYLVAPALVPIPPSLSYAATQIKYEVR